MLKKSGYTPWVARKAPLFNKSLNTTYIRLSSAALITVLALIAGILSGLALSIHIPEKYLFTIGNKVQQQPVLVKSEPAPVKLSRPNAVPEAVFSVPAIPMVSQINTPKSNPIKDMLIKEYKLSAENAELIVNGAQDASDKTGIEATLLLAIAAKSSHFQDGDKWVGIMHVRPEKHPKEVNAIKEAKVALSTIDGSFRLGAEVLATYQKENGNDTKASVAKLLGLQPTGDTTVEEVLNLKTQLDELK